MIIEFLKVTTFIIFKFYKFGPFQRLLKQHGCGKCRQQQKSAAAVWAAVATTCMLVQHRFQSSSSWSTLVWRFSQVRTLPKQTLLCACGANPAESFAEKLWEQNLNGKPLRGILKGVVTALWVPHSTTGACVYASDMLCESRTQGKAWMCAIWIPDLMRQRIVVDKFFGALRQYLLCEECCFVFRRKWYLKQ